MNVKSVWCVSVVLVAGAGACTKPPPVCEPGTRYYEAYRSCIPACERVYSYEDCYGRDGEVYTDGAYDGPRADAGDAQGGRDAGADGSDSALVCDGGESACAGRCVSTQSDPLNCGACGRECVAGAGARATCAMGACASECLAGFERVGDACEPGVVRPVFPPVTSTVTSRRPTLRWASAMGVTGAQVELCRDRACATVIERIDATGESARPTADLPANRVVFWRLRARVGAVTGARTSPTWQFRTGVLSPAVDTAHGVEADFNGDGFSDVAVGDANADSGAGVVSVYYGSATGLSATAARVLMGGSAGENFGYSVASVGDVNGDGFADFAVSAPNRQIGAVSFSGVVEVFFGRAEGVGAMRSQTLSDGSGGVRFGAAVVGLGDTNTDGFADVAIGRVVQRGMTRVRAVAIHLGTPTGVSPTAAQLFEGAVTAGEFNVGIVSLGDSNGDGRQDLLLDDLLGDLTRRTYAGSPTGISTVPAGLITSNATSLSAGSDVNGDGYADIVETSHGEAWVRLGDAAWQHERALPVGMRATATLDAVVGGGGDFNGDGYADLLLPIEVMGQPRIGLFRGSASGLSSTNSATMGTVEHAAALRLRGDMNGDGLADAVLASPWQDLTTNTSVWFGTVGTPSTPTTLGFGRSITP